MEEEVGDGEESGGTAHGGNRVREPGPRPDAGPAANGGDDDGFFGVCHGGKHHGAVECAGAEYQHDHASGGGVQPDYGQRIFGPDDAVRADGGGNPAVPQVEAGRTVNG